jgi:short-subunit dehydrogenase
VYNASKFGLNGFSEALMLNHRYDSVRVSYIMPGSVDRDLIPAPGAQPGRSRLKTLRRWCLLSCGCPRQRSSAAWKCGLPSQ